MDPLAADRLPWLEPAQALIRRTVAAGRLPHAMLLQSPEGLGAEALAHWILALALCDSGAGRPCGVCASCLLLRSDSHPDAHVVRPEEDAQQIKVDQIRELIEALALKSYRGGYKVGLIERAEMLNVNGANAFLKTLEEPGQDTLLILIADPSHRLPATIASRCRRMNLRAPAPALARAWLAAQSPSVQDWDAALALSGGAPLLAVQWDAGKMAALDEDMRESLEQWMRGTVDVTLLAERWVKSDPSLRLRWLENWITQRVNLAFGAGASRETAEPVCLPAALLKPKIRTQFELLDAVREFRRFASTSMNQQLALEALLLGGRAALMN